MPAEDQRDGLRVLAAAAEFEEMDASNTEAEITVGNLMRYQIHQSCTTVIVAEFEGATGAASVSVVFCQSCADNQSRKGWSSALCTLYCISASVTRAHACVLRLVFYMHTCSMPASFS
ncbi:TPA: hypothetical protein ACH3X1_007611 [Trebouxia sp. C0004]